MEAVHLTYFETPKDDLKIHEIYRNEARKRLHAGHARPERQRRHGYRAVRDVLHRLFLRLRRRKPQDRF